jgi:outer membrane autotransporter protein
MFGVLGYAAMGKSELVTGNPVNDTSDMMAVGAGVYGIWLGRGGWFADIVARQHYITQDITAFANPSQDFEFETSHLATSASFSLGRQMLFNIDEKFTWFVTPYINASGAFIMGDSFVMNGYDARMDNTFSGQAGGYVMVGPRWRGGRGQKVQLYMKTGYTQDIYNAAAVNFDEDRLEEQFDVSGLEIGAGFNYRSTAKQLFIYAEALQRIGFQYRELTGIAGLRYEF